MKKEALKKSWDLTIFHKEGMHIESVYKGEEALLTDGTLNRIGKYSPKYKNREKQENKLKAKVGCFCGSEVTTAMLGNDELTKLCTMVATWHYKKIC